MDRHRRTIRSGADHKQSLFFARDKTGQRSGHLRGPDFQLRVMLQLFDGIRSASADNRSKPDVGSRRRLFNLVMEFKSSLRLRLLLGLRRMVGRKASFRKPASWADKHFNHIHSCLRRARHYDQFKRYRGCPAAELYGFQQQRSFCRAPLFSCSLQPDDYKSQSAERLFLRRSFLPRLRRGRSGLHFQLRHFRPVSIRDRRPVQSQSLSVRAGRAHQSLCESPRRRHNQEYRHTFERGPSGAFL